MTTPPRHCVMACPVCGCLRVEAEAWADVNRDSLRDFQESGSNWCPRCEDHPHRLVILYRREGRQWTDDAGNVRPSLRWAIWCSIDPAGRKRTREARRAARAWVTP